MIKTTLIVSMLLIAAATCVNAQTPPDLRTTIKPPAPGSTPIPKAPPIPAIAVIHPQILQVIRAVPVRSQVTALEAEKKRLQQSALLTDAMFYVFDTLTNVFGAGKNPGAKYSPPIEFDQGEMVDIHKAIFLIQKKIDEIKNGSEWAYLKYHERMRKLGVNIAEGVQAPKPGETRMWPREPDRAVIRPREPDSTAPIQMRDCSPLVQQYREWLLMPVPAGFDQRSGEAVYNWIWKPFTKERSISRPGC